MLKYTLARSRHALLLTGLVLICLVLLSLCLAPSTLAATQVSSAKPSALSSEHEPNKIHSMSFDHQHQLYSALLERVVHKSGAQSRVNYSLLKDKPEPLMRYLEQIQAVSKESFERFSREQKIAFLLNYYNAHQLLQVIEHYPLESIRDLGFLFFTPWKDEFFTLFGQASYLDYIGHDLLSIYDEPRIHFALNCASISCPALLNEAYRADILEQQLTLASKEFLSDPSLNHYSSDTKRLHLSPIFKWYLEDFGNEQGLARFLRRHMPNIPLNGKLPKIKYNTYNWGLNDIKDAGQDMKSN